MHVLLLLNCMHSLRPPTLLVLLYDLDLDLNRDRGDVLVEFLWYLLPPFDILEPDRLYLVPPLLVLVPLGEYDRPPSDFQLRDLVLMRARPLGPGAAFTSKI